MRTQLKKSTVAVLTAIALAACAKKEPAPEAADAAPTAQTTPAPASAHYKVVFTPQWTKANFPREYPDTSLIHKPHFSGWIGTAHNDGYAIFKEGTAPTPGLEALSEMGKHAPLDEEIHAAIAGQSALALAESEPLKDFSQTS